MIYLDYGATSFHKPASVYQAVLRAMKTCASPGRGGYAAAMGADRVVYHGRETAAELFDCRPEQVAFTTSCTHGLNIAIRSLVRPGGRVVISGFEHNAVVRPLYALGAAVTIAGRKLFDWEDTLSSFDDALKQGADAAVFTHISNVFGYILPVEELAKLCRDRGVPFIVDAAQSAGVEPVKLRAWGADFIAMPGHKSLLGPQGTGILLCAGQAQPLVYGGTGSASRSREMPPELPERLEAGTMNVPGIAGLTAGMKAVGKMGIQKIGAREASLTRRCADALKESGIRVWAGPHQAGVLSFLPPIDCEEAAAWLARRGFALRAGLHCAPLAHESGGSLQTGTVRFSPGWDTDSTRLDRFLQETTKLSHS